MEDNLIILILYKIFPELPDLAGDQWDTLAEPLQALLAELAQETDTQQQDLICYEILQLLKTVPVLIQRFDQEMELSDPSTGPQITRGSLFTQLQSLLGRKKTPGQALTRFIDISCPRKVWIQTRRISIVVRLNEYPSTLSDAPDQALPVQEEKPVQVRIDAPDFTLRGPGTQELVLSSKAVSDPLVFDLAPHKIGFSTVHFDFTQDGNFLGSTELPLEITKTEVSIQNQEHIETPLHATGKIEPPDFTLYITCKPAFSPSELHFRLVQRDLSEQEFLPLQLVSSLKDHTKTIYRRLTNLMSQVDSTALAILGTVKPINKKMIDDRLRKEGMNLWKELIPLELRARYEREREEWSNKSLLIISDEPDIPWELLWPYGDAWSDPHPLCLQMNLSRWLRRSPQEETIYQPKYQISLQKLAAIVPLDTQLPFAARELSFLDTFMHQHSLQDVSPREPTYTYVTQFLEKESYDWIHVATHGNFYPADPEGESAIWLLDQQSLTPRDIVGEIAHAIRQQRPAFVFNACEVGHQGWAINGLGGWASRLIGAGAGLFLAPLWPVDDYSAYRFTTILYQSLLSGKTIAEAVRQARLDSQRAGDPTWLAYSLYAHPNASVM